MEKPKKHTLKQRIITFSETRLGHALLGAVALALAYIFGSWAIDTGNMFDWAITFVLLIIAARETVAWARQATRKK